MSRLTPLEIQRTTFPRKLRGLDPDSVREFLGKIAEQIEEEARTRGELRAQLAGTQQQIEELQKRIETLTQALPAAQRTAETTLANAAAQAQRVVTEAETLAARIVDDAARRGENIELLTSQLRGRRRAARADLKRLAELLEGAARDDEATEAREAETPTVTLLRRRPRETKEER
ncbi:MAG: DivIVA domain-containing protein [Thermoanaerobaculales bacterium]